MRACVRVCYWGWIIPFSLTWGLGRWHFSPALGREVVLFFLIPAFVCVCVCVCVCACACPHAREEWLLSHLRVGKLTFLFAPNGDSFPSLHLGWDTVLFSPSQKRDRGSRLPLPTSWGAGLASTPSPQSRAQVAGALAFPGPRVPRPRRPQVPRPRRPEAPRQRHWRRVGGGAGSAERGGAIRGPAPGPARSLALSLAPPRPPGPVLPGCCWARASRTELGPPQPPQPPQPLAAACVSPSAPPGPAAPRAPSLSAR